VAIKVVAFIGSYIIQWARHRKLLISGERIRNKEQKSFNKSLSCIFKKTHTTPVSQLTAYFIQGTTLDCRMTLEFLLLSISRWSPHPFLADTKYANKLLITSECNPCTEAVGILGGRVVFLIHNSNFTPQ